MDIAVLGVGMTRFTKMPTSTASELAGRAIKDALDDAELSGSSIQAGFCGNVQLGMGVGQAILRDLGLTGLPVINVENACASGATALREAVAWIESGSIDVALVFGVELLTRTNQGLIPTGEDSLNDQIGLPLPGVYALRARRYMDTYGATVQDLASVVVKNRHNGSLNPLAHFQKPVNADEVLSSALIADPITLLQCCPNVDGAAAVIVSSRTRARKLTRNSVQIAGVGMTSGHPIDNSDSVTDATRRAAQQAYKQAGIGPEDVDVCELHDPFSIAEILNCEELGFCREGEGTKFISNGRADIDGDVLAVNPSGGLLARGHPLGASGVAQIVELFWQLKGLAQDRQRSGARVALAQIAGGNWPDLDSNACLVHVLTR